MEPTLLGLVLDSSVLIAAERAKLTTTEAVKSVRASIGDVPIVICALRRNWVTASIVPTHPQGAGSDVSFWMS